MIFPSGVQTQSVFCCCFYFRAFLFKEISLVYFGYFVSFLFIFQNKKDQGVVFTYTKQDTSLRKTGSFITYFDTLSGKAGGVDVQYREVRSPDAC